MTEHPFPRRRQDLRITDQEQDDEKIYIVVDEESGRYYQFRDVEFDIFWNLDGDTSLTAVKEKIEESIGDIEIPLDHLESFVEDLKKKGLLEGTELKAIKRSLARDIFYLRFKALNPDNLLENLVSPLSFIFTKQFIIIGLILITYSLTVLFYNQAEWSSQVGGLFHGWNLLVLYCSLLAVAFVHEMGHALTCKYYGGSVKEMGFMLIYFQPAFYANVTDAYLFRDKMHKVFVGAAGLFFQFVFGALVITAWIFSIPGSFFNSILVAMMGMSGFTAFMNFNPLIKLDGYYILSDILGVTNLRPNSFRYINLLLHRTLFNLPETNEQISNTSPRLRRIYFWYGILGMAYTTSLLFFLVKFLAFFLTRNLQGFGLLIFTAGFAWGIWNWYKRAGPAIVSLYQKMKGNKELETLFNSKMGKLGIALLFLFLIGLFPARTGIKGPCEVKPDLKRALAPLESGIVAEVLKREGEPIKAGEVFAILDNFDVRRELANLKVERNLKREHLTTLKGTYGTSLTQAEQSHDEAKLALTAHSLLSPYTIQEAHNNMNQSYAHYLKAKANYTRTHNEYLSLLKGNPPDRIAQPQEELKKAEADLKIAKGEWERFQQLDKQDLASPKEIDEKRSAFDSATSEVARLKAKLALARLDLEQDNRTTNQEYLASWGEYQGSLGAYHRISKQATDTEPEKLREQVNQTRKNLSYTLDQSALLQEAQSDLDGVNTKIRTTEEKLHRMELRSPIDGVIMTPRVKELQGKMIMQGQPIAWVYKPGPMIFEIRVDEMDISEIPRETEDKKNDVSVKILALPGQSFKGKVRQVIPESLTNPKGKAYLVDVAVDDKSGSLLPGMQGTGKIYGYRRILLWQFVRRAVKYVFWKLWSLF